MNIYYIKTYRYILNWCNSYIIYYLLDITEAVIHQQVYWFGIIEAIQMEVFICDTSECTKKFKYKYGKLTTKLFEEIPWNKLWLY